MALNLEAIGERIGPLTKDYDWKDVVIYALGVGAGFDDLDYVYEERLKVIPSFAVASIFEFIAEAAAKSNADLSGVLHGEQDIVFHSPIPTTGTLTTDGAITHMYDKGDKGALVVAQADTYHSDGPKLYTNTFGVFCRKDGGFGGEPGESEAVEIPDRDPDFVESDRPTSNQPLLYRLSGDVFALHVDPEFAKRVGFEMPIMHGLCTHGFACRAVIRHLFPDEPERITRFRTRFSKPLYPGLPIETRIWKTAEGRAVFRSLNAETGEIVIDQGVVEWMSQEEAEKRARRPGIRFDGQVAVVTGAGHGLGRAYAEELAARGAKVVVNDLGGARDGTGDSQGAADEVVRAIVAAGGEAVASYDSVATPEGGEAIVAKAIETWGRIDVLVNNAGILRDKSLTKLEPEHWQAVLAVHFDGAFHVTRPAFIAMREQGYGRIVMTTSAAGLYGNFGQTNYSAAKMGVVGLMHTLKLEGAKRGIKVNTISPIAATRMTEDVLPPDLMDKLKPEFVVPMVVYLCSEPCPVSGAVYNAGMGYFNRALIATGPGAVVGDGKEPPTPAEVAAAMKAIAKLEGWEEFPNAMAAIAPMLDAFSPKKQAPATADEDAVTAAAIFERLPDAFQPDKAAGVDVVFQFDLSGDGGGSWFVVVKEETCEVTSGSHDSPTTSITMDARDFVDMITGKLNAMKAYTGGKLRIGGDLMKSQLIEKIFSF